MSRLHIGSPLLEELSGKHLPHIKHKVLVDLLYRELRYGVLPVTIREISDDCVIDYNVMNQVLRRMRDYQLLKSENGIKMKYVLRDIFSKMGITEMTLKGDHLPSGISSDMILEKKQRRVLFWYLTTQGRRYAKFIWYNPERCKMESYVDLYSNVLLKE